MTLPPLPAPARSVVYNESKGYGFYAYTAAQMENYARAAIAAHVPAVLAAVPAQPGIRTLSSAQIERHTLTASECPPDSAVMLVSSINRLLGKSRGEGIQFVLPVAWLCSLMMEDGTTRTQIVEQDPAGLRWNDDGEPSPYKVQPLYAAPQAVPVPADMALTDEQIDSLTFQFLTAELGPTAYDRAIARAIEAAHNITAAPAAQKGEKL